MDAAFIWIILVLLIISEGICRIGNLVHVQMRWRVALGVAVALFCVWTLSAISVGGTVLPSGEYYPWNAISSGIRWLLGT